MLYSSVAIANLECLSQLNYTAHLDDFEIGDLIGGFTKKLVTRMDDAP